MSPKGRYGHIKELCLHPKFNGGCDHTCAFITAQFIPAALRMDCCSVRADAGGPVTGFCNNPGSKQYQLKSDNGGNEENKLSLFRKLNRI